MTNQTLITGANRGIGLALARRLASGGPVIGTTRTLDPDLPPEVTWKQLEVVDPASHAALAADLDGAPIQHLICNAGVYLDKGESLRDGYPADMWANAFAVNVTGVFLTVQALLPNLLAAQGAKVMIISSQMASHTRAPGGSYIYRASKAAVLNLGRNLATDLASQGVAVGIYHPGWVSTGMGGSAAPLDVESSAKGLAERLSDLSLDKTGCFETWEGQPHPY